MNKIIAVALASLALAACGVKTANLKIGYEKTDTGFRINCPGVEVTK